MLRVVYEILTSMIEANGIYAGFTIRYTKEMNATSNDYLKGVCV